MKGKSLAATLFLGVLLLGQFLEIAYLIKLKNSHSAQLASMNVELESMRAIVRSYSWEKKYHLDTRSINTELAGCEWDIVYLPFERVASDYDLDTSNRASKALNEFRFDIYRSKDVPHENKLFYVTTGTGVLVLSPGSDPDACVAAFETMLSRTRKDPPLPWPAIKPPKGLPPLKK